MAYDDTHRSLVAFDQNSTLVAVIEMSQSSWLVAGLVPGLSRDPLKKLDPDPQALLAVLQRWQREADRTGHSIGRIAVAYEAGRDGFWLARWLRARGIEAHVMHSTSIAVPRTHRRAKSDRLDTGHLQRSFLGWLRGEPGHCTMAPVPTLSEEDARRPNREHSSLTGEQTRIINRLKSTLARFGVCAFNVKRPDAGERLEAIRTPEGAGLPANTLAEMRREIQRLALVREQLGAIEMARRARRAEAARQVAGDRPSGFQLLARVHGLGLGTADLLDSEAFTRQFADGQAVGRYGGLTGAPDESGNRRREKGLARAGNVRVRHAMIQFAWRFLRFQPDSALAHWYRSRTEGVIDTRKTLRKKLIVALARKLLVALWRMLTTGQIPAGLVLKPAA